MPQDLPTKAAPRASVSLNFAMGRAMLLLSHAA